MRPVFALAAIVAAIGIGAPTTAHAACNVEGKGEVNLITNSFPSLELIKRVVESCSHDGLRVTMKLTEKNVAEITQAFSARTSPFDGAQVANSSITAIQAANLLMPLNDLVAKYKDAYAIEDQTLIKFGADTVAVAFQVNAQHLYYRKDLLEKHGIAVPSTYDELLAALEKLKGEPSIDHPFTASYATGWDAAEEFTNIFLAMGGEFFQPGTAEPGFDNEKGIAALELMKKLLGYMSPNALNIDTTMAMQELQQGKAAIGMLWAERTAQMDNPAESSVVGKVGFARAPSAVPGGPAATTLWWDGFVIPKNLDGDPDLTFRVIMEALRPEVVAQNNDIAIWLRSNYKPTKYATGVVDSVAAGAPPYPMTPQQTLVHSALGANIADFLGGKETAEQSLADAADAYRQAAKDKGLLD